MVTQSPGNKSFHEEFNEWWKSDKNVWKTQAEFAQHLGIGRSTIGDYLVGRSVPKGEIAKKLHEITGLDILKPASPLIDLMANDENKGDNPKLKDTESRQGALVSAVEPDGKPFKTFRIAVSGDVVLRELECQLIDTRVFQRLRSIKQLGTSYLVYPSATHTRFEHSLGTLFEADRMMSYIENNPKSSTNQRHMSKWDKEIIRLAALLHDICHIPFGHTLEDETGVISTKHDGDDLRKSLLLIDSPIGRKLKEVIGVEMFDFLIKVLFTKHKEVGQLGEHAYIVDIVNNTLCADLLDYLRRDIYFCNLREDFGDRFMRYLYLDEVKNSDEDVQKGAPKTAKRLVIRLWKKELSKHRRDVLSELAGLLRTRYTLGEKVYYHHAKNSSSSMIARAVWSQLKNAKIPDLSIEKLCQMGDEELLLHLANDGEPIAKKLALNLLNRQLYKTAYVLTRTQSDAASGTYWTEKMVKEYHENPENRVNTENQLALLCGLNPGDVLVYCPDRDMGKKYARMLVEWKDEHRMLKDIDDPATKPSLEAIEKSHELLWNLQVFVKPEAKSDTKCMNKLKDFCESIFEPYKDPQDSERRFESALMKTVNEHLGNNGTVKESEEVVSRLVAVRRDGRQLITSDLINHTITEIRKK